MLLEDKYLIENNLKDLNDHILSEIDNNMLYQIPNDSKYTDIIELLNEYVDKGLLESDEYDGWNIYLPGEQYNDIKILKENMDNLKEKSLYEQLHEKVTNMCEMYNKLRGDKTLDEDKHWDNDLDTVFEEIKTTCEKAKDVDHEKDDVKKLLLDLNEMADKMCAQLREEEKYSEMCSKSTLDESAKGRKKRWYETTNSNYKRLGGRIQKKFKHIIVPYGLGYRNGYNDGVNNDDTSDTGGGEVSVEVVSIQEQKKLQSLDIMNKLLKKKRSK